MLVERQDAKVLQLNSVQADINFSSTKIAANSLELTSLLARFLENCSFPIQFKLDSCNPGFPTFVRITSAVLAHQRAQTDKRRLEKPKRRSLAFLERMDVLPTEQSGG